MLAPVAGASSGRFPLPLWMSRIRLSTAAGDRCRTRYGIAERRRHGTVVVIAVGSPWDDRCVVATAEVAGPLHLVLGEEEFLVERAVREVLAAVREQDPQAEKTELPVSELTAARLAEVVSPSLFAEGRVVVLRSAQDLGKDLAAVVADYLSAPAEGVVLVVQHSGGGRSAAAKELPGKLRRAGARVVECAKITRPSDREAFVRDEVRRASGRIDPEAVSALIDAVGTNLRELASAASQLVADTGGRVDADAVRRYHTGRAEVTGFAVAEKAVVGDRAAALEALRWALQLGVAHVLIADALADAVRTIARLAATAPGGRGNPNQLGPELGLPPWKVRKAQQQVRGWEPGGLTAAMRIAADVNADVKGGAANADYALERAVLGIVAARSARV